VALSPEVQNALARDRLVDITTTGRRSGRARRIEIGLHNLDGRIYLTGLPGRRGWYANLVSDPAFTLHLKQSVRVDLHARARPIREPDHRRPLIERLAPRIRPDADLNDWLARSPLVEVEFLPDAGASDPSSR
jgi:hypothetical protein